MSKHIGRSISDKYSQKPHHHTKQSVSDAFKTASKRAIQKPPQTTGDLVFNKIADKIMKV